MRILIVDDYEVVRLGLSSLLADQPGWEVQAEAGTVAEAIQLAYTFEPDVVVWIFVWAMVVA